MKKYTLLFSIMLAVCTASAQDVKNPVWPHNWPDPTIWQDGSEYFCIATRPLHMLRSTDLMHWEMAEQTPIDSASWDTLHRIASHYWAPDVTCVNGRRLLYLTLYNSAEDSNIAVLRQENDGQFHFVRLLTRSRDTGIDDTIDPEVVEEPRSGRVWLFFGSVGGIHRIQLSRDGENLLPGAKYEHVAGRTNKQDPSRQTVFEGSYLHRHGKYWYLFVSSGFYGDHTYTLQVGRSKKLTGTFRDREGRPMAEGHATPVIQSEAGDFFYGPGHCGEIYTAANGKQYIFYHSHVRSTHPRNRPMMMQEILWDKAGWPYVEGGKPSATP